MSRYQAEVRAGEVWSRQESREAEIERSSGAFEVAQRRVRPCHQSLISKQSARAFLKRWSATPRSFALAKISESMAEPSRSQKDSSIALAPNALSILRSPRRQS